MREYVHTTIDGCMCATSEWLTNCIPARSSDREVKLLDGRDKTSTILTVPRKANDVEYDYILDNIHEVLTKYKEYLSRVKLKKGYTVSLHLLSGKENELPYFTVWLSLYDKIHTKFLIDDNLVDNLNQAMRGK